MRTILCAIGLSVLSLHVLAQSKNLQPRLINYSDIGKNKSSGKPIIYLTGQQWKEFVHDAEKENSSATKDDTLYKIKVVSLGSNPFESGVIMFGSFEPCPPGCDQDQFGNCHCEPGGLKGGLCHLEPNGKCSGNCPPGKKCKKVYTQDECGLIRIRCKCE